MLLVYRADAIHTIDQVVNHPHVLSREMILDVDHPIVKNLKMAGFPIKLSDTPASLKRHPPLLGEHTDEILSELGLLADDIEQLKQKHIVGEYKECKSSI